MKTRTLFVPAKYDKNILISDKIMVHLPNKLMIFTSVQFLDQLKKIKTLLESKNKKIVTIKSKNFLYEKSICEDGQLLGCNIECFDESNESQNNFDAFLYIGDGVFHPKALLIKNRKDIYCYNPKSQKLEIIKKELHDEYQKKKKGALLKFLSYKEIGILITTKPGQKINQKKLKLLKEKIKSRWPQKNIYLFTCNEINFSELENFNFIDIFINTGCPRIAYDDTIRTEKTLINADDLMEVIQNG